MQSQRGNNPRSSSLSRRDPFSMFGSDSPFGSLFQRWNEEMDRFFEDFGFGRHVATGSGRQRAQWSPEVEVRRRGNELIICADLPGLNKEDVNVELRDDAVIIQGERKEEHEDEREGWYRSERNYGSFYRTVPLPEGTITDSAKATFKNGVLEVVLQTPPKEVTQRKVNIE
jgi:HSP20 family protein